MQLKERLLQWKILGSFNHCGGIITKKKNYIKNSKVVKPGAS